MVLGFTFSELDKRVQVLVDKAKVAGFTLTIYNQNAVAYQKSFGYSSFDSKDSLKVDQVFYGASLSKAVFGYLVAHLAHEGIIDLDKPLQNYLEGPIPEMKFGKVCAPEDTLESLTKNPKGKPCCGTFMALSRSWNLIIFYYKGGL